MFKILTRAHALSVPLQALNVNELNWMKLVADSLTALQLMCAFTMNMCTLKVNPFLDFVMTVGYNGMQKNKRV